MAIIERDIEEKLRRMVERRGGLCLKWVCPGWAGVPDRILLLPGGRVIFVETKRPLGGKLAPLQLWWLDRLRHLGFKAISVRNVEDIHRLEMRIFTEKFEESEKNNVTNQNHPQG